MLRSLKDVYLDHMRAADEQRQAAAGQHPPAEAEDEQQPGASMEVIRLLSLRSSFALIAMFFARCVL